MRKQYHLWPTDHGFDAWDVDRLIELTAGLPEIEVEVAALPEIDTVYWFNGHQEQPTVRKIAEHARLIAEVDLRYPIILAPDGRVMDGMHRVARALLEGRPTITAVRLETMVEPDYRDCQAEDLPYDEIDPPRHTGRDD